MSKDKLEFNSPQFLIEMVKISKGFSEGIFVRYDDIDKSKFLVHPCGWDFISFESIDEDVDYEKMIHKHQTISLLKFSEYEGVVAGFLFNFRHFEDSDKYNENTYFMEVNDFQNMCDKIDKKSFNEIDAILNGAIKISGSKKRTRYKWDLESLFRDYDN